MENRYVGLLIIGIVIIFFFVIISFNNALEKSIEISLTNSCSHEETCPMQVTLKNQKIISYSLMGLLLLVGLFITFFMKEGSREELKLYKKEIKLSPEEIGQKIEDLEPEEKTLMQILLREEGSVYQSDLIKETSLSKVKISRLLDRLEGKGLIERKRRGMTNIIILRP